MSPVVSNNPGLADRQQALLLAHGGFVLVIGLLSGFGLLFRLLEQVSIWPIPWGLETIVPGTVRGWQAAHVGGILNGVMIMAMAPCLPLVPLTPRVRRGVVFGLIFTGWANTIFYQFGNLAANRGLSGGDNIHGRGDLAGLIAYLPAAIATVITTVAVLAIAIGALHQHRNQTRSLRSSNENLPPDGTSPEQRGILDDPNTES